MASTSVAHLKPEDVLPSLTAHNASFMTLLDLIPPNYYLSPQDDLDDDEDDQAGLNTKYMKNKRKAKQEAQLAKSSKKKEKKRAKLDPANIKTVSQVQSEREKEKNAREAAAAAAGSDAELDLDFDGADQEDDDEGEDDDNEEGDATIGDEDITLNGTSSAPVRSQHDSITTLRQRLQNKIASMQNRRRIPDASSATGANMIDIDDSRDTSLDGEDSGDGDSSVASTRDELLEERRKRRGEVRDNRRRARKEMRRQALANANSGDAASKNAKGAKANTAQGSRGSGGAIGQTQAPGLLISESKPNGKSRDYGISSSAPTDLNFSSFQMPGDEKKKRDRNALPSNPKQALAMLEARKAKAAESGVEPSEADTSSAKWSKALSAAKGVKIRDDEALLKRSVKRIEKQKAKSSIEWKDRKQEVKDKEAEKQKKRTENLKARKDAKMAKKKGGAKGGGKKTKDRKFGGSSSKSGGGSGGRAGFEGKKMGKGLKMGARKGGSSGGGKK